MALISHASCSLTSDRRFYDNSTLTGRGRCPDGWSSLCDQRGTHSSRRGTTALYGASIVKTTGGGPEPCARPQGRTCTTAMWIHRTFEFIKRLRGLQSVGPPPQPRARRSLRRRNDGSRKTRDGTATQIPDASAGPRNATAAPTTGPDSVPAYRTWSRSAARGRREGDRPPRDGAGTVRRKGFAAANVSPAPTLAAAGAGVAATTRLAAWRRVAGGPHVSTGLSALPIFAPEQSTIAPWSSARRATAWPYYVCPAIRIDES